MTATVDWIERMKSGEELLDDRLAGVDVPVLVLRGTEDRFIPEDVARGLAAQIPGASYRELPGCGHALGAGGGGPFARALREFLDQLETGPRREK